MILNEPITEEWLKEVGFKWHQLDGQPEKQWLLWLGDAVRGESGDLTATEDIGIELCQDGLSNSGEWFCWLRSDCAHRYSRFIHVRHMRVKGDVIRLIVAITDQDWNPENHIYGSCMASDRAASVKAEWNRLDKRIMRDSHPWREIEKDDSRGGALPEHMQHAIDAGLAK